MYSRAADQPLYCVENGECVSCNSCQSFKNDPGNVRSYTTMQDCQVTLKQTPAMEVNGGQYYPETNGLISQKPSCACE